MPTLHLSWLLQLVLFAKAAVGFPLHFTPSAVGSEALALLRRGRAIVDVGRHEIFPGIGDDAKEKKRQRIMDAISKFRAEICAKMHKEHGVEFGSYESCLDFMNSACKPGNDQTMDGDRKETTSRAGYCNEFFPEAEKKAEKQVADEDAAAPSPGPAMQPGPAPGPAPMIAEKTEAPAPAEAAGGAGPAPAPGPFGAPAGPAPAPFIPGVSAGKPPGPIAKDEAWYYKKSGQDMKRMHMEESKKLPTQGYWGKLVEHEDKKTATQDWQTEFGTKHSEDSFNAFCKKNPTNPWCDDLHRRSTASCLTVSATLLLVGFVNFAV